MYTKLKFSWAHILAFLALIGIGYVTFVGLTYDIDDGFHKPAFMMLGILAILILWFIGAQQLKGIDNDYDFRKCIWWERICLFTSPFVFAWCMLPFNHAMNVSSEAEVIEETFKSAIDSSAKLFDDYEIYAKQRIGNYEAFLNRVKSNGDLQPSLYKEIGFTGVNDDERITIEIQTLTQQLTENYDSLNVVARAWIDRVNQKTSVWNVFLVGNIKEIETSILDWGLSLQNFSKVILSTEKCEDTEVKPFDADKAHIDAIIASLNSLSRIYNPDDSIRKLNYHTIIWGIVLYLLLLFPYIIQERNGVSTYTVFGRRFMHQGINMSGVSIRNNIVRKPVPVNMNREQRLQKQSSNQIVIDVHNSYTQEEGNVSLEYTNEATNEFLTKEERRKKRQERRAARNNVE